MTRRVIAVLVLVLGTVGVAAGSYAISNADRDLASASPGPATSIPPLPSRPVITKNPDTASFADETLPNTVSDPIGPPTATPIWQADGRWFGALLDPLSLQTRLYQLSGDGAAWQETGRVIDERQNAVVDVVTTARHVYIASVVRNRSTASGIRLTRYTRDPTTGYRPDADFPVFLTDRGVETLSLAADSTGRLWLAFIRDGAIVETHSTGSDAVWSTPVAVPGSGTLAAGDVAGLVPFGPSRLGLVWSEITSSRVRFVSRADGDAAGAWSPPEVVSDGLALKRNALSVTAEGADGVVVSIASDARSSLGNPPTSPRLIVVRRSGAGAWSTGVVSRVQDRHDAAAIAVDETNGELDVVALRSTPEGAGWVLKRSTVARLEFDSGPGQDIAPLTGPPPAILAEPHLAKGPADPASGILVVGFDTASHRYVHSLIVATDTGIATGSPGPSAGASPPPILPIVMLDDTFEPLAVGTQAPAGWQPTTGSPTKPIAVANITGRNHILRLTSPAATETRACKDFGPVERGVVTATTIVRLGAIGTADATLVSLRFHGNEAALGRFGIGGTFAYYAGATKIRTTAAWKPGTWYRSIAKVDLDRRTWSWSVFVDGSSAPLVRVDSIPFREPTATSVGSICIQTSSGKAGLTLDVDRVVVTR